MAESTDEVWALLDPNEMIGRTVYVESEEKYGTVIGCDFAEEEGRWFWMGVEVAFGTGKRGMYLITDISPF